MNIFLANDDGIDAAGLYALVCRLAPKHRLFVCAPQSQQSAVSKALTLYEPLRAEKRSFGDFPSVEAWAIKGTPVDCVRLGLGNFVSIQPDLAISGVNQGPNLGTDTLYSGTCAAAQEAALRGIPSIALSDCSFRPQYFDTAAALIDGLADTIATLPLPFGCYLNVNVPDLPHAELKGLRLTRLGQVLYEDRYERRVDTIGHEYWWAPRERLNDEHYRDTDEYWIKRGYATVTPMSFNNAEPNWFDKARLNGLFKCETEEREG